MQCRVWIANAEPLIVASTPMRKYCPDSDAGILSECWIAPPPYSATPYCPVPYSDEGVPVYTIVADDCEPAKSNPHRSVMVYAPAVPARRRMDLRDLIMTFSSSMSR